MPIDGTQCLDPNDPDYGLPMDTCCVGNGGPTPMEAAEISKSTTPQWKNPPSYDMKEAPRNG